MVYRLVIFCLNIRINITYHYLKSMLEKHSKNGTNINEKYYRHIRYKYSLDISEVDKMLINNNNESVCMTCTHYVNLNQYLAT